MLSSRRYAGAASGTRSTRLDLSNHQAQRKPSGLVTIMRDQEALGLVDLRPIETKTSTSDLCENFMELARKQLLPLARADIIHPDIRVGYDYTANIMAKSDGSNMVLVDFESLVLFSDYTVQEDKHRLYLPEMKNAFAFVCLQCYVVAVFWSEKKNQLVEAGARTPLKYALYGKDVLEADVEGLLREIALQLENSGRLDTALLRNLLLSNN